MAWGKPLPHLGSQLTLLYYGPSIQGLTHSKYFIATCLLYPGSPSPCPQLLSKRGPKKSSKHQSSLYVPRWGTQKPLCQGFHFAEEETEARKGNRGHTAGVWSQASRLLAWSSRSGPRDPDLGPSCCHHPPPLILNPIPVPQLSVGHSEALKLGV